MLRVVSACPNGVKIGFDGMSVVFNGVSVVFDGVSVVFYGLRELASTRK